MSLIEIQNEAQFHSQLALAGSRLVVADFTATWCLPCQHIAAFMEMLPQKYPKVVFLKIDVDKCQDTAASQGVSAMPTFIFYKNKCKIDRFQGSDIDRLEAKIQQYSSDETEDASAENFGLGLTDLNSLISIPGCECLNEADQHNLSQALTSTNGFLQSDCDEQLIISVTFNQMVKIHSLKIKAPVQTGPKDIKLFINRPNTLDFDTAESANATQELTVNPADLESGAPIKLRYVKFQNVQNIQMFVRNNQSGGAITQIDHLCFIGAPLITTKMQDFKRVSGKKGETYKVGLDESRHKP